MRTSTRPIATLAALLLLFGGVSISNAQPVMPAQQLLAPDAGEDDQFGYDVATTGQYMAISALADDDNGSNAGAVYVFKLNAAGPSWDYVTKLYETDGTINGSFGYSVAMTPGTASPLGLMAIGHVADNQFGNASGAVFIHSETSFSPDPWSFQKKVVAVNAGLNRRFGESVAIDISTLLVGSPGDQTLITGGGAAHIHYRNQGGINNWGSVKKLNPPDPLPGQTCGENVALDGDIAVVSARGDSTFGSQSGAAYVYLRNQGGADNWGFAKKLLAPDGVANHNFGYSVAVSGNIVAVGARSDSDAATRAGATYIFDRYVGAIDNFGFVKKLVPPDGIHDAFVSDTVALHDGILVTGSSSEYSAGSASGAFYVYGQDVGGEDNWGLIQKVHAPDAMNVDFFASDLDIRNGLVCSGARLDDTIPAPDTGSAWVFSVDSLCPADLNGDGVVDTADLGILLGLFGGSGLGDFNLDGVIDTADLGVLLGGYGDTDCAYAP
ncbi:MAG: hypothetical protein H6813_06985 [Phycisphaeraceae bacterium]|nr:hypothetical protein [Phycisphaeraceae bacterium]MCB9848680.1 hypothetical protein [Phycisphaeraceae bacterium]